MITIFTIPKPFVGHIKTIQLNAIRSWLQLQPRCQIILFGNELGVAEAARDLDVQHVPVVAVNEFGTPMLDYTFHAAHRAALNNILCFANTDMILMSSFMKAVEAVAREVNHFHKRKYLVVGRRWNLDITGEINFSRGWERKLTTYVLDPRHGVRGNDHGIDFFVFPRRTFEKIPAFAVGRGFWDNWMVYDALRRNIPVIDISDVTMAIHQNHDYSHHPQGQQGACLGAEGQENLRRAGGMKATGHWYGIADANKHLKRREKNG